MYGTHKECGGRYERRHGKFSSVLTCTRCGAKKRLGVVRSKMKQGRPLVDSMLPPRLGV